MARFMACALLAVLAVFPLALARPASSVSDGAYALWADGAKTVEQPSNDDHILFSIQSSFEPTGTARCMDVDGSNVLMADCAEGKASQLWYVEDTVIVHQATGKCMDVCKGPDCYQYQPPGAQMIIWPCHKRANQQFKNSNGNLLVSLFNNNCVDVCNAKGCQPRYDIITYPCHGWFNQQWSFLLGGYKKTSSESVNALPLY